MFGTYSYHLLYGSPTTIAKYNTTLRARSVIQKTSTSDLRWSVNVTKRRYLCFVASVRICFTIFTNTDRVNWRFSTFTNCYNVAMSRRYLIFRSTRSLVISKRPLNNIPLLQLLKPTKTRSYENITIMEHQYFIFSK